MRILIIGNPVSGVGKSLKVIESFYGILKNRGHIVDKIITSKPGDAKLLAGEIGPEVERIVIAGGDGTINEVINGLKDPSKVPAVHLATGTANMLTRDLRLPRDHSELAKLIENGETIYADLGKIGNRLFLQILSVGFDAAVAERLALNRPKTLGYLGYIRPILGAMLTYRPVNMRVIIDDDLELNGASVMLLKVRHYGGYFVFSHDVAMDSGQFEIVVLHKGTMPQLIKYAFAGFFRQTHRLTGVTRVKGRKMIIESHRPVSVQIDGDYLGKTPIQAEMSDKKMALIRPVSKK